MATIVTLLFIFQLVSFSLLFALYLKVKAKETDALKNKQMYEEMQKSLIVYIDEMKKENDRFLEAIDRQQSTLTIEKEQTDDREGRTPSETEEEQWKKVRVVPPTLAHQRYQEKQIKEKQQIEESVEEQEEETEDPILMLYENGHTIEEIAKQLQLGKTEVELHIKFRT